MNKTSLIAIFVLFCAVAGLYFFVQRPHRTTSNEVFALIVPEFDVTSIDGISVWTPRDTSGHVFKIKKSDGSYWIEVYEDNESFWAPCQEGRVKRLLESLRGMKGEERARGKEYFSTFNIGSQDALHFELKRNGGVVAHILVGKRGSKWGTSFVRKSGDDRVFIVQKNLFSLVDIWDEKAEKNPPPGSWLELGIVKDGADAVQGVSYSSAEGVWSLESASDNSTHGQGDKTPQVSVDKEGKWVLVKDGSRHVLADGVAKDFLRSLFPLYAQKVRAPSMAREFGLGRSDDYGRFTIHFKTKGLKILHIGKEDDEKRLGWIKGAQGVIYEVSSDILKKMRSGPDVSPEKEDGAHNEQEGQDNP